MRRGLDVVQADLNKGLAAFADGQFDFVVLSQTLQTVLDVSRVLRDMLRVGRRGIVSFPNVAYRKLRTELAESGRAPRVHAEHGFRWHDTPYLRSSLHRRLRGFLPRAGHLRSTSGSPSTRKRITKSSRTPISMPTWR